MSQLDGSLALGKFTHLKNPWPIRARRSSSGRWIRTSTCWLGSPFSSPRPHGLVGTKQIWFGEQRTAAVGWAAFAPNVDTALSPINITAVQFVRSRCTGLSRGPLHVLTLVFLSRGLGFVTNPSHLELAIRFSRQDTGISIV